MKRVYTLMALFGFGAALIVIFTPYFLSTDPNFSLPYGTGIGSLLRYYFLSLTFFVIFTAAATMKIRSLHGGRSARWFWFSLLAFSIGSLLAIASFYIFIGSVVLTLNPTF